MPDFFLSVRDVVNNKFIAEPGAARYLQIPDKAKLAAPEHETANPKEWIKALRRAAVWGRRGNTSRGDILFFIHGYNNGQEEILLRHRALKSNLVEAGYKGEVVSFDWPCADSALGYLEDRHDAKQTAMTLVKSGIEMLAKEQRPDCAINIHLLCHSTGAYVAREAFSDASDANLVNNDWRVSQIVFIAGDISSDSMKENDRACAALYNHCIRLTNYSNGEDSVLKLSNFKRLGLAPRAGRVGIAESAPRKAVNVDCTAYYHQLANDSKVMERDQKQKFGTQCHTWHIGNKVFIQDFFETIKGDLDRASITTRMQSEGSLRLQNLSS